MSNTYHHGDLRSALIEAAAQEIDELGVGAISLRSIARRVGVSHAAPAHHFKDRTALISAVAADGFERLTQALRESTASVTSPSDALLATGLAYVQFAKDNPARFSVMFRPELLNYDLPDLAVAAPQAFAELRRHVLACQEAGWRSADDPDLIAMSLWSTGHGLATLIVDGQASRLVGELDAARITSIMYGGGLPPRSS